jgi:hypothetical protein
MAIIPWVDVPVIVVPCSSDIYILILGATDKYFCMSNLEEALGD